MLVKYEKIDKHKIKIRSKPQSRQDFDQPKLLALADSLVGGQLQPIGVLSDGTLIWGERRLRAALLKTEITHLWAAVFDQEITETEFLLMRAAENFQRSDLKDYEKWLTCKELCDANPQWQLQDLAARLHLSPATITKLLSPAKCSPPWQQALAVGRVGIGDCYAASGLAEAEQAALLTLKLSGASRDDIVQAARKSRKGNTPTVKVTRVKLSLPSGVSIVASGPGLSLDDLIQSLGEAGSEAKKARSQDQDIKSFQAVMTARSKKRSA
jgi:ParB family transcriptional regulator, chromosome partitioning protein